MRCHHCQHPIPVSTDEEIQFPVLSCKHILCGKCIAFALITSKFSFTNIESIILACPVCSKGTVALPLQTIKQLITIQNVSKTFIACNILLFEMPIVVVFRMQKDISSFDF